jgi:hypothetical protein
MQLRHSLPARFPTALLPALLLLGATPPAPAAEPLLIRSARGGPWSDPATWEGGNVPSAGVKVQIRPGHRVVYDVRSEQVIRSLHIAGVLTFGRAKDTRLDVGLVRIQATDDTTEEGFDCHAPASPTETGKPCPALEVGTPEQPLANHTALIRLVYVEGMDKETCPAIVCCGGRMDFHGAAMSRTWAKLGATAKTGDTAVTLAEAVSGWRVGDRIILTATTRQNKLKKTFRPSTRDNTQTEERFVKGIDGAKITLDKPLTYDHQCEGNYRGDVADLSRTVVVESADPDGVRGHTMYHRGSAGSISYAEFRHLGKDGVLGKYSLHYHLAGDTMRGSYVLGASIWDSHNRWLTIHGTNYLVVRDCVGYQSRGHGFFLEDGTEVYNLLDRNLAVQAYIARPLPKQVIPFDKNDGAGFWWANSLNSFTRNVACECDEYGYFFQAAKTPDFDPVLSVRQADGGRQKVDIRTLPFVRFEDNESHCQRRHAFNLGGGVPFGEPNVGGVGPDEKHPFVIRNFHVWNVHWAMHPVAPSVLLEDMDVFNAEYGVWRPVYKNHAYRGLKMEQVPEKTQFAFVEDGKPPNKESDFPKPLDPVDDMPPVTVITGVRGQADGSLLVRGSTADNGTVKKVLVNGREARALAANFLEWEATLEGVKLEGLKVSAHAEDAAGNVEKQGHVVEVTTR